jgi:hypothetical protein
MKKSLLVLVFAVLVVAIGIFMVRRTYVSISSSSQTANLSFSQQLQDQKANTRTTNTTTTQSNTISSTFFGMDMNIPSTKNPFPDQPIGAVGKAPGTSWFGIETCPGGPDPSNACYNWKYLDLIVAQAQAHNIPVIYTIDHIPPWAEPASFVVPPEDNTPANLWKARTNLAPAKWQYLSDFVTALATHYKGKIQYYEEYNEPDDTNTWNDTYANLVTFGKTVYQGIKAVDPNALVGGPAFGIGEAWLPKTAPTYNPDSELMTTWAKNYFLAGGNKYADFSGYHPYDFQSTGTDPSLTSLGCNMKGGLVMDCAGQPIYALYDQFRSMMDSVGLAGKPIILTEGGVSTTDISASLEPAYLARWYILNASAGANGTTGVTGAFWYGWNITPFVVDSNAGVAYGQVYNWLVGAKFTARCSAQGSLWTCPIVKSSSASYQGLIVWNADATKTYTPPSQFVKYRDLAGNTHTVNGPITVNDTPVLLEN